MTEEKPLVSVIVRTKDRPMLLKNALQSIADQTCRPLEVVLVNDGGCDLDIEDLSIILDDILLIYIKLERNKGRAYAGNAGIKNASGDYIGFLDDDDEFYPDHIETLVSCLKRSDVHVAYTDAYFVYKVSENNTFEVRDIKRDLAFSEDFNLEMLVFENYIPFMCLLFERNILIDSGGFDTDFDLYEDWDLLIRLGAEYSFHHIKKITANYFLWSAESQVSQMNKDYDYLKRSYVKIVSKHIDKITPDRIHGYVSHLGAKLRSLKIYKSELDEKNITIEILENALRDKDSYVANVESALEAKETYIQLIHSGHGWKLLTKYFSIRDKLLPEGTKRRLFMKLLIKTLLEPRQVIRSLNITRLKKFLYDLKVRDSLTIERKIEQKLSESTAPEVSTREAPMRIVRGKDKDYFSFAYEMNTRPADEHVPISYPTIPETDIKLIAFYLPQFHPIPENDKWWGKGFTEWANVTRAVPQFIGHYQPRLPEELGFYDLRILEVQKRQAELAGQYGIFGFCFHFYWFNGKTLLEDPVKRFAENIDFPFCINWANENWTRRWDGYDNDILIAQNHSFEDDIAFIEHVSHYFRNRNYIRINGKPLMIVYRPALFPNPRETAKRWREWCRRNRIGEIYLGATHAFEHVNPKSIGFDAVIEFPPNTFPLKDISKKFKIVNPHYKGIILDYTDIIEYNKNYIKPPYKKFRGICPGWDNEARKPGRGTVLVNSSPDIFKQWLKVLCSFTDENFDADEKIVFMNAWNEWAEGTYFEPDKRYGYAYLQAVADALKEYASQKKQKKILYVCHDAHFHGAQILSLNIVKVLKVKFQYDIHFILKSGGELESEYAQYASVYNFERDYKTEKEREKLIEHLYNSGIREALCNTVVSGDITKLLSEKGVRSVALVHELPRIIKEMGIEENALCLARYSSKVVFPSDFVKDKFNTIATIEDQKTEILPQGLFKINTYGERRFEARRELREKFSLPEDTHIVLGVGFGDYRKGVDLFVEVAKLVTGEQENVYFLWVGNLHVDMEKMIGEDIKSHKNILFESTQKDISIFYAGADVYLLTSREDPFPIVVLDAMHVGLPVIGFHDAGGFKDIVHEKTGALVSYLDIHAMAKKVIHLLGDNKARVLLERNSRELIEKDFNFVNYIYGLLALVGHEYKKISVIIPNYNYGKYLKSRIESILTQTYPVYEVIILDDASTDNSIEIAERYLDEGLNIKLVKNESNSGSVFKQWVKGIEMAKGDYIWIAEADDLCEDRFIEELLSCFEKNKDVVLAYCQSKQIDERGAVLNENYFEYTNDIDKVKWRKDYMRDGVKEISDTLTVKNTIPNISAVIFKKTDIGSIAHELINFKVAGDWFFYIWLLKKGKISYLSKSLNLHRRHEKGITKTEDEQIHYNEVVRMQEFIMKEFDVPVEIAEKAHFYKEFLVDHFGLNKLRVLE